MVQKPINEGPLLKAEEAARRLNLSRSKVYLMLKTGELECVRFGKSVRVPESALDRLTSARNPEHRPALVEGWEDFDLVFSRCRLDRLQQCTNVKEAAPVLLSIALVIKDAHPLCIEVVREEVVKCLTQNGVRSPGRIVDLAFHPSTDPLVYPTRK